MAGLSGSVAGHVCSFAALGCLVVEVLSPAPGRAALWSHAVCPAASSAPRGAFAYSVYPLRGLETVSRATRCRSLRAAIALLYVAQAHEKGAPLLLPPAGQGRSSVSCDQVRAVIGSSWFCAACGSRLSGRQLPLPRAVETMSAPSKALANHLSASTTRIRALLLVELGGIEPPSSTHPLQPTGSVSAATRPSHCGPTKAHPCSPSSCARFLRNSAVTADPLTLSLLCLLRWV